MSFKEKVVIVTGASSGIGAATAIKFSKEGANVVIVARNKVKLEAVAEKCEKYGIKPLIIVADLVVDVAVKKIVDTTLIHFGKLNILINNAGVCEFIDITSENIMQVFDEVMSINVRAAVYLTNLCIPHLIKTKGNIINITSVAVHAVLYPENCAYAASKAALDNFTKSIASDLAVYGVRVNAVAPGPVKSDFVEKLIPDKTLHENFWNKLTKQTALGKLANPVEVADLILFVASDKAKSATGTSFAIENGILLKGLE